MKYLSLHIYSDLPLQVKFIDVFVVHLKKNINKDSLISMNKFFLLQSRIDGDGGGETDSGRSIYHPLLAKLLFLKDEDVYGGAPRRNGKGGTESAVQNAHVWWIPTLR